MKTPPIHDVRMFEKQIRGDYTERTKSLCRISESDSFTHVGRMFHEEERSRWSDPGGQADKRTWFRKPHQSNQIRNARRE